MTIDKFNEMKKEQSGTLGLSLSCVSLCAQGLTRHMFDWCRHAHISYQGSAGMGEHPQNDCGIQAGDSPLSLACLD